MLSVLFVNLKMFKLHVQNQMMSQRLVVMMYEYKYYDDSLMTFSSYPSRLCTKLERDFYMIYFQEKKIFTSLRFNVFFLVVFISALFVGIFQIQHHSTIIIGSLSSLNKKKRVSDLFGDHSLAREAAREIFLTSESFSFVYSKLSFFSGDLMKHRIKLDRKKSVYA